MWPATTRYRLTPAPGGLGFVHDLLSTAPAGAPRGPDLLGSTAAAQDWLDVALADWGAVTGRTPAPVALTARDTASLRRFRDALRRQMTSQAAGTEPGLPLPELAVTLRTDLSGEVRAEPRGNGWKAVAALALIEVLQAQYAGTWPRLKICRNQRCQGAFYDHSRNNSGAWHDVRICGNQANVRAYRARQQPGASPSPSSPG